MHAGIELWVPELNCKLSGVAAGRRDRDVQIAERVGDRRGVGQCGRADGPCDEVTALTSPAVMLA